MKSRVALVVVMALLGMMALAALQPAPDQAVPSAAQVQPFHGQLDAPAEQPARRVYSGALGPNDTPVIPAESSGFGDSLAQRNTTVEPSAYQGATRPSTGEFYPAVDGGIINPRTGEFLPDDGGSERQRPVGVIDSRTGTFMPSVAGGIVNPHNGTFHQEVGGGYVNSRTGQFTPK